MRLLSIEQTYSPLFIHTKTQNKKKQNWR